MAEAFSDHLVARFDLLDRATEDRFTHDLGYFKRQVQSLSPETTHVILDEVQKIPSILDDVHWLIENGSPKRQFVLTGSSARKLKFGGANLLAGRAFVRYLFPFVADQTKRGQPPPKKKQRHL